MSSLSYLHAYGSDTEIKILSREAGKVPQEQGGENFVDRFSNTYSGVFDASVVILVLAIAIFFVFKLYQRVNEEKDGNQSVKLFSPENELSENYTNSLL